MIAEVLQFRCSFSVGRVVMQTKGKLWHSLVADL
ncbi:hypothetical protein LINGRAHAP2_LOCUS11870 [Linum grandiflorum]